MGKYTITYIKGNFKKVRNANWVEKLRNTIKLKLRELKQKMEKGWKQ